MAEINESDLFGKGVIEAPLHLAKNLGESVSQLDALIARGKEFEKIFGPSAVKSIGSVKKEVEALSLAEIELEKIQKQIAVATARDNDEYAKQVKKLKEVRDAVKDKTKVTEQEAKAVKAETASIDQLRAALERNRQAYKALVGDQQRFSKSGKELKSVIDSQDKALKELNKSMGDHRDEVGHYELAQDGLNKVVGVSIENFKTLGKSLIALASNPFFLAIAGVVGIFKALQGAIDFYYTSTLEGEDAARKSATTWESFFEVFRTGTAAVGKESASAWDRVKQAVADAILGAGLYGGALVRERKRIQDVLNSIVEETNKLFKEHIKDVVDDANTELRVNKLLEDSKDKLRLTDEQRLQAVRDAGKALNEQLQGDIELADRDVALLLRQVGLRNGSIAQISEIDKLTGKQITRNKTLAEMSDQEILNLKLTGEEIKRLSDLQVARINLESKAATQRKMLNRSEFQIVQEIETARVNRNRREEDATKQLAKTKLEIYIAENKRILKEEELTTDQRLGIMAAIGQQEIELLNKQREDQIIAIRRTAEDRNKEMAQILANGELEKNATLTAKQFIEIQDKFLNDLISKDTAYLKERNSTNQEYDDLLIAQKLKTKSDLALIEEQRIREALKVSKEALDEELLNIKKNVINHIITRKQGDKLLKQQEQKNTAEYLRLAIQGAEEILRLQNLPVEEAKKVREELKKLNIDLINVLFGGTEDKNPYERIQSILEGVQQVFNEFSFSIGNLFQSLTDRRLQQIDQEDKALTKQHENYQDRLDRELENFIGTEEDKKAFADGIRKQKEAEEEEFEQKQEQLERKRIQAQRKAAEYDKAVSAVQAAIGTSLAVIKLGVVTPLAIAAGIAGAIQVAAILARPIPQFYEGGTAPGGPIITGELGTELMREPSGKTYLSKPFANVMHGVPAGTQIMDHESTMRALAMSGLGVQEGPVKNNGSSESVKMLKEIRNLNHTIKTKKETHFHFDKNGVEAYMRKSEHTIKLLNKLWR